MWRWRISIYVSLGFKVLIYECGNGGQKPERTATLDRLPQSSSGILGGNWRIILSAPSSHEVTGLLLAWSQGEQTALEQLVPLVYAELHRIAHRYLGGERPGHTLETTELVNEAYLRLIDARQVGWQNRAPYSQKTHAAFR